MFTRGKKSRLCPLRTACLLAALCAPASHAADATHLEIHVEAIAVAQVMAAPSERAEAPAFLSGLPGVALRSQGYGAPQADLSIRGAPFSSSGLMIAGLPLYNPQTEHFQADLSIPADVFSAPELLTGLDQFRFSAGHPAGSVAMTLAPIDDLRRMEIGGGAGEQFGSLRACASENTGDNTVVGASTFGDWGSIASTDGYKDNYLNHAGGGGQLQMRKPDAQFDLLGAYGWRQFGARGFYGAPAAFPSEENVQESLVLGSAMFDGAADAPSHVTAGWQQTDDRYWLDRTAHDLYANHTVSDVASAHGDTRMMVNQDWAVDVRGDASEEWIDGVHSGLFPGAGLGTHERGTASGAVLPRYTLGDVTVTAGGALDVFTDDRPAWLPAAGVEWRPNPNRRFALDYTEAVREPSYTELDYESPGSLGNSGLQRQLTRDAEFIWREHGDSVAGGVAVFAEEGCELVDWAKLAPGGPWTAINLDRVYTVGMTADVAVPVTESSDALASYQALGKWSDTDLYASRYVLDYPRQTVRVGGRFRLTSALTLNVWQELDLYADNPARTGTSVSPAAGAELRWQPLRREKMEIAIGVVDPWNSHFETYPGQPAAGSRGYVSGKFEW